MGTKKWFVLAGEEEMGPLGPNGLRKLVRTGKVTADTLVRREDQAEAVPAARVLGLLAEAEGPQVPASHGRGHARHPTEIPGPYTSLWPLGAGTATLLCGFAMLGVFGVVQARRQLEVIAQILAGGTMPLESAQLPLFGVGVFAVMALIATGGLFVYWLFTARINLPHLIRVRMATPKWQTVTTWFVPLINLLQPYTVVAEIDRLSAEAAADGDARVRACSALLVPWWITAIVGTGLGLTYMLLGDATADEVQLAAWFHLGAGICTVVSAALACAIVLRITVKQENAHRRHAEPVTPHRDFGHGHRNAHGPEPADAR
jgi:hypothetical protein